MPVAIPLAIAGASVAGAAISSRASSSAARTVQQSTDRAADLQNQQFQQLLRLQMPAYDRANAAGSLYSQALGIPTGGGQQPQTQPYQSQGLMTGSGYSVPSYDGRQDGTYARMMQMVGDGQIQGDPVAGGTGAYQPTLPGQPQANGTQPGVTGGGQLDIAQQVMNTPGYQAQLDQGIRSIDRAAPLTGGMYSGRRMKALNDYGQQTFGSYYNDWMNRVGGVAGQTAQIGSNIGQQGMQNAQNVGNLMMTGANARAQGALNGASAWTGALGNIAGGFAGAYG